METISRHIKKTLTVLLVVSLFASCSKTGPEGPVGPAGAQGPAGTAEK